MKLSIVLPVYRDYGGVWAAVFERLVAELFKNPDDRIIHQIIVVNNDPEGPDDKLVTSLAGSGPKDMVKVVRCDKPGTAQAKEAGIQAATGDVVVVMDSHVIPAPGCLESVLIYFQDPSQSRDLLQGPLLYQNFQTMQTHFDSRWRGQMLGTWGLAWEDPEDGETFSLYDVKDGTMVAKSLSNLSKNYYGRPTQTDVGSEWEYKRELPGGMTLANHQKLMTDAGFRYPTKAFEVPGQGMGFFAFKKESWVGFNPGFLGFGWEEMYIHHKVRLAGGRCVVDPRCLWVHRFGNPHQSKGYTLSVFDKVRNYVIGYREFGWDVGEIAEAMVAGKVVDEKEKWKLSQTYWSAILDGGTSPPDSAAGQWQRKQAEVKEPIKAQRSCGGAISIKGQPTTVREIYDAGVSVAGDIELHGPRFAALAAQTALDMETPVFVDAGSRPHVTAAAFAVGGGKRARVHVIAASEPSVVRSLRTLGMDVGFLAGSSLTVEVPECDGLFVDTDHSEDYVLRELINLSPKVRKWIALHDTNSTIFPGPLAAVRKFLESNPHWRELLHDKQQHGMLVLARTGWEPRELKERPVPAPLGGEKPTTVMGAYYAARVKPGPIQGLLPVLQELAATATGIVGIGVGPESSAALLSGSQTGRVWVLNQKYNNESRSLAEIANGRLILIETDPMKIQIPDCELLVVESRGNSEQIYQELKKHGPYCSGRIAVHNTSRFAEFGEGHTREKPVIGLLPPIRHWLKEQGGEWFISGDYPQSGGMTVLSRLDGDRPPGLPSKLSMAATYVKAMAKHLAHGGGYLPEEEAQKRYSLCMSNGGRCPLNQRIPESDRCAKCGCYLTKMPNGSPGKVYFPSDGCPLGLWGPGFALEETAGKDQS